MRPPPPPATPTPMHLRRFLVLLVALLSVTSLRFLFSASEILRLHVPIFPVPATRNLALLHPPPPPHRPSTAVLLPDSDLLLLLLLPAHPHPLPTLLCLFPSGTTTPASPAGVLPTSRRPLLRCSVPSSLLRRRHIPSPRLVPPDRKPEPEHDAAVFHWNFLVYESTSTPSDVVLYAKGVNNRRDSGRPPSDLRCVFRNARSGAVARTAVTSSAQEVFRCRHPDPDGASRFASGDVEVSLEVNGAAVPSVARYAPPPAHDKSSPAERSLICACTMVRDVAKFLPEWVTYHLRIGVDRFVLYDNGSEDGLDRVVSRLVGDGHNVTTNLWPWPKTQEAGFSHAAVANHGSCEWMIYMDVDEFVYSPEWAGSDRPNRDMLPDLLRSVLLPMPEHQVGQVMINCRDFGPSGLTEHPVQGVTQGYTCRRKKEERHKSLVRLDSVDKSLLNVVHHFRLKEGFGFERLSSRRAVVNHYKYQAWPEFRNKFKRRVSAYVVDWTRAVNAASRDRAPGLGFEMVEPEDWPKKFCEVRDTQLKEVTRRWFSQDGPDGPSRLDWEDR